MHTYKMRAECIADVAEFLKVALTNNVTIVGSRAQMWIPDVEVTFTSSWSLAELKFKMAKIEDGHVMYETIHFEDQYTGERR